MTATTTFVFIYALRDSEFPSSEFLKCAQSLPEETEIADAILSFKAEMDCDTLLACIMVDGMVFVKGGDF